MDDYINRQEPSAAVLKNAQREWTLCSERMPEEHVWPGTNRFGTTISDEVYVTFKTSEGKYFTEHLRFRNGRLSEYDQMKIDALHKGSIPIAWMPLPAPYEGRSLDG